MYEGRTRGKKLKYTYSDEEELSSDEQPSTRRSNRNAAPAEASTESRRPRFTASGRQIRSRAAGLYGEAPLYGQRDGADDDEFDDEEEVSRPQRTRTSIHPNGYSGYDAEDLEDASEAHSSANDSGNEWRGVDDDLENDLEGNDEENEASGEESDGVEEPESLVVQLRYGKGDATGKPEVQVDKPPPAEDVEMNDAEGTTTTAPTPAPAPAMQEPTTLPHHVNSAVGQQPLADHVPQPLPNVTAPSAVPDSKPQGFVPQDQMTSAPLPTQVPLGAGVEAPEHNSIKLNGVTRP